MSEMTKPARRFLQPSSPAQRRYEALRARFVDGCSLAEAAARFGYSYGSFRNLCSEFLRHPDRPLFPPDRAAPADTPADAPRAARDARILALRARNLSAPQIALQLRRENLPASVATISKVLRQAGLPRLPRRTHAEIRASQVIPGPRASHEALDLQPRSFHTLFGGLFLFLPALLELDFPRLVQRAKLPGSGQIPPLRTALSLLALKLWGIGRPHRLMPDILDEGIALFAGLNAIPQQSTLTEYSTRVASRHVPRFTARWLNAAEALALPRGASFDLDFHSIPYHGHKALVEKHFVAKRSRSQKGILAFVARDADASLLCFANANVQKADQHQAVLQFVEAFRQRTGSLPAELVFDSRLTTYSVLARLDQLGIRFLTLRRRTKKLLQALRDAPAADWRRIRLYEIERCYRNPRVLESKVELTDYPGTVRQIAVKDLGHDKPTLLLTNHLPRHRAARLVERSARRMVIENCIQEAIAFFHLDALSAALPLRIDVDLKFTLMGASLYRMLATRIGHGHEKTPARQLFNRFVRTPAKVRILPDSIEVRLGRRAHNPLLIAAGFADVELPIPWIEDRKLRIVIGYDKHGGAPAEA